MPVPNDPSRGIQLKEGSFTFPSQYKCRVDIDALKEIPQNFEICRQGIEALNDLFYEVPPEQKEGVVVEKAIWENVLERIQETHVFNASSSYTDLSSQALPVRVLLDKNKQSYPLDSILVKDLSNPFLEKKRFARELLDIVAAVKTIREEKLFQYENFHIFPSKDAFVLTDTETGERHLTVALHCMAPAELDENINPDEHTLTAIKDLIRQRWDYREFRKVLNAQDLNTAFDALRHLSQDIPTLKMLAIKSAYAGVYVLIGFIVFSLLMLLTSFTPWNRAVLQDISFHYEGETPPTVKSALVKKDSNRSIPTKVVDSHRILLDADGVSPAKIVVDGTYHSPMRLDRMGGLLVFDALGISNSLDRMYNLHYEAPLKLESLEIDPAPTDFQLKIENSQVEQKGQQVASQTQFQFRNLDKKKWGRTRFFVKAKGDVEKQLRLETIVMKKGWTLEAEPSKLNFEQAITGKLGVRGIRIYANPPPEEKARGAKSQVINESAFFHVTFENPDLVTVPIQIQYLRAAKGNPVATVEFGGNYYHEKDVIPTTRATYKKSRDDDEFEDDEEDDEEEDSRSKLRKRAADIFELGGQEYYALNRLPQGITSLKVASKSLPDEPAKGKLHIAVPGIEKSLDVPINFIPQEKILFAEKKEKINNVEHIRNEVTALAYPLQLQKKLWEAPPTNLKPVELGNFIFEINNGGTKPIKFKNSKESYGALGLGIRLQGDPNTLYFYNTETGKTGSITDYNIKDGVMYFSPKAQTYKEIKNEDFCFEAVKQDNYNALRIREEKAKATSQLYFVVLTDKNVENSSIAVKWDAEKTATTLEISARSEEALRVVRWKEAAEIQGISQYTPQDWIENVTVQGPLNAFRYNVILFSGEEAVKDVSDQVYLNIQDSKVANTLYQTTDGDWFVYNDAAVENTKALQTTSSHLKFLERNEDKDPPHNFVTPRDALNKENLYFLPVQRDIGRVGKYLVVPGKNIQPNDKDKKTVLTFYYPQKEMSAAVELDISREEEKAEKWNVSFDDEKKAFTIQVKDYRTADYVNLASKLKVILTCAATQMIHQGYHTSYDAHKDDKKWAEVVRWSLESIGFDSPKMPPSSLGRLGSTIGTAIQEKQEFGLKMGYKMMREALLLGWSPQTEDLLNHHLALYLLQQHLASGKSLKGENWNLQIKNYDTRKFPAVVDSPVKYEDVTFTISYDKLLLGKSDRSVHQLREAYYYGVPKDFASSGITSILRGLYSHPDALPEQTHAFSASKVKVSEQIFENVLKYSLWEERLNNFSKQKSKFWFALMGISPQIADVDGKIDDKRVNQISKEVQKRFQSYFLSPVDIRRVYWKELKPKVRGKTEVEANRDNVSSEESAGLLRFVERAMMPQFTDKMAWYTNFTFVIDRLTLDKCPYHRWVYLKSYRPGDTGGKYTMIKLFKKEGLSLYPYPGQDYNVTISSEGDTDYTKLITVSGATIYQNFFDPHTSKEIKASKVDKRLRLEIFYSDSQGEYQITRAGGISPPVIDFEIHPASVMLYEVSGYHLSPDRFRELVRGRTNFAMTVNRNKSDWKWQFVFDNGPVLAPFAYRISESKIDQVNITIPLVWKQTPPPSAEQRSLTSLTEEYDMEFLYMDVEAKLPIEKFFPYRNFKEICTAYDRRELSEPSMHDLLERLFKEHGSVSSTVHFKWRKEFGDYYAKKQKLENDRIQTFRYAYNGEHQFVATIYEDGLVPKEFVGNHPVLKVPEPRRDAMTLIWKIGLRKDRSSGGVRRGFPKFVLSEKLLPNVEPVVRNN